MFSTLPRLRDANSQFNIYSPHVPSPLSSSPLRNSPSPLSPRDANLPPRTANTNMSSPSEASSFKTESHAFSMTPPFERSTLPTPPSSRRESNFSKRATKSNPLIHGRGSVEEGRETRRKLFLKNVREASEEKKWNNRGGDDEIMRCIWVAEQRRLQERMRKEAMGIEASLEEGELSLDELMADEVAMKEEQEMEALLGYLNQENSSSSTDEPMLPEHNRTSMWHNSNTQISETSAHHDHPRSDTPYGSDDDEYDDIFMDVIQEEERLSSQQQPSVQQDQDMMDMS